MQPDESADVPDQGHPDQGHPDQGHPDQGHVPTPFEAPVPTRSLGTPAALAIAGLGVIIGLDVIDLVLTPFAELATLRHTSGVAAERGDNILILAWALQSLAGLAAFVFTAAAFITWLYLARKNIVRWGITGLGWGPGWAIGGWFIPFANLVIPKLVVDSVWRGSSASLTDRSAAAGSPGLIWAWWLTFLLSGFAANAYARHQFSVTDDAAYIAGYNSLSTIPSIIAAMLAIILVRRVTAMQERRSPATYQW
jgi:Domain of unknown function (DUF4328)